MEYFLSLRIVHPPTRAHDPRQTMEALAQVKAALDAGLLAPADFARAQSWFVKVIL